MPGPLNGIKVVEFTEVIAGPLAGMLLADMGAEVIKIEPPWGDPWRLIQSFSPTESRPFLAYNRGKKSLTLDLTTPQASAIIEKLILEADVVIANYRPDVAVKLGVDYKTLYKINPALIYCENTAFGRKGPDANRPGYDIIIQAMSGLMASEGKLSGESPEHIWSSPMIDTTSGFCLAWTICGALFARERTGKGQMIETTLMGTALMLLGSRISQVESMDFFSRRDTVESLSAMRQAGVPFKDLIEIYQEEHPPTSGTMYYRAYQTKDNAIAIGCLSDPLRKRLLNILNLTDMRFEPNYDPLSAEASQSDLVLIEQAQYIFKKKTTDAWLELLTNDGIPAGPIRFIEELFDEPQIQANDLITDLEHAEAGQIKMVGLPAKFSETPLVANPPPSLGQQTDSILEELGFTDHQIQILRTEQVIK